jgi:hypothetical protein
MVLFSLSSDRRGDRNRRRGPAAGDIGILPEKAGDFTQAKVAAL